MDKPDNGIFCSEWCVVDAWDNQLIPTTFDMDDVEEAFIECDYCTEQIATHTPAFTGA